MPQRALICSDQTPSTPRSDIVFALFSHLRACGIPFAVLNGVSQETGQVGRDVDILVRRVDVSPVAEICRTLAAERAWTHVTGRWLGMWYPGGLYQLVFHRVEHTRIINIAFDLVCSDGIAAGLIPAYSPALLVPGTDPAEAVPINSVARYMKRGFVKALAGSEAGFIAVQESTELDSALRQQIRNILGADFLKSYETCLQQGRIRSDWRAMRRKAQLAYAYRHPVVAFRNGVLSIVRRTVGKRLAHVQSVAIVGPEGVGKSCAIQHAQRALVDAFLDVRCRHRRRERVVKPTGRMDSNVNTAGMRVVTYAGPIRLLYYWLESLGRYWIRDRRSTSSEIPVNLYHGCALEMIVNPGRFGLRKSRWNSWPYRWLPAIDRVILLHDRLENIASRNPQLSKEEIRRQLHLWEALYKEGLVHQVISIENKTDEAVGAEVALAVLDVIARSVTRAECLEARDR